MKAILTRYLGPTDFKGSRIKALEPDGKYVMMPYDHALNSEENHRKAAWLLCERMRWSGKFITGGLKHGYAHVFVE